MTSISATETTEPASADPPPFAPRPGVAAVLNLLGPGLGYLYAGRPRRAALATVGLYPWVIALVVLSFVAPSAPLRVGLLVLMLAVSLLILPVDAARVARRVRSAPRRRYQRWYTLLAVWLVVGFGVQGPAVGWIKAHVAAAFRIPSGSMTPTLMPGDFVLASSRAPSQVRRGDVVIYRVPRDDRRYVHRVAGLPGDTLAMHDFHLVVNGRATDGSAEWQPDSAASAAEDAAFVWQRGRLAPGVDSATYRPTYGTWGPLVIRRGEAFVLGDDRPNSLDSRYRGLVPLEALVGRPEWIYFSRDPASGTIRWSRLGRAAR